MWLNPQETADLVTFTEEILNGKFHFLGSESCNPFPQDFSKPWHRITLKYYSYLTYESLLTKELSSLLLDSQVKAKVSKLFCFQLIQM